MNNTNNTIDIVAENAHKMMHHIFNVNDNDYIFTLANVKHHPKNWNIWKMSLYLVGILTKIKKAFLQLLSRLKQLHYKKRLST